MLAGGPREATVVDLHLRPGLMDSSALHKITIVIPAHRAEKTIARAIDGILAQSGIDPTIIVVVNPDVDATAQIVRGYNDPRVRAIINNDKVGAQHSRNLGLDLVQDEFVMFHCADDFVEGPLLASLADEIGRAGADLAIGPMQTYFEHTQRRGPVTILEYGSVEDLFIGWLGENRFVVPCCLLWRTSFVRQLGGWDPDIVLGDDGLLVMKAILAGAKIAKTTQGRGIYVIHNSPTRLTRRSDKLESLLKMPETLLAIQSTAVSQKAVQQACASNYYLAAQTCFVRGRDDLGEEALRRSRALGLKGHRGSGKQRFLSRTLGLKLRCKLEYAARLALGRPGG
jgi:GT2 family glycosyltransferase